MKKHKYISIALYFLLFALFANNNLSAQDKKAYLLQRYEGVKEFITKKSTKKDLNDIKHNLERQGIFFSYTNLKYNSKKEITSISIKLKNKESEFSGEWNQKNLPIPNIKIVEINGVITVVKNIDTEFVFTEADNKQLHFKSKNNKEPIYIVDGKIVSSNNFSTIDTKDIESISVLKGKAAKKKYGNKGKNGVILIKMKKQ